jgi:hypothetical protein
MPPIKGHPQLPTEIEITYHNSRRRRYVLEKMAALALVLLILLWTYQPHYYPPYRILNHDVALQISQGRKFLHEHTTAINLHDRPNFLHEQKSAINLYNRPTTQYDACESVDLVSSQWVDFNITDQFHFLDTSIPSLNHGARGAVKIYRGDADQSADVVATVITRYGLSSSIPKTEMSLEANATLTLEYTSTSCVEVEVLISMKANTQKHLKTFDIRSEILDINIGESLSWTVDNLTTHTSHGNTDYEGSRNYEPLITHNVSSSSRTGDIFGYYVATANLALTNDKGRTGVFITPRSNSDVPTSLSSIAAHTGSGPMHISMAWHDWPMIPHTHSTHISSQSGVIWAAVPHGRFTNISSDSGAVDAILMPFGTDSADAQSEIHTSVATGDMHVHIYNSARGSPEDGVMVDPLLHTHSRHKVEKGRMRLRYPDSWYGELELAVSKGTLQFDATRLESLKRGGGWVKARRGDGGNFMESWVLEGEIDATIGLGP